MYLWQCSATTPLTSFLHQPMSNICSRSNQHTALKFQLAKPNLGPLLQSAGLENGGLRWKQCHHPLLPTAVGDLLGVLQCYANTLVASFRHQPMSICSRCTHQSVEVLWQVVSNLRLRPLLWAWNGVLRWKQCHPLLPTAVETLVGVWQWYESTEMTSCQH